MDEYSFDPRSGTQNTFLNHMKTPAKNRVGVLRIAVGLCRTAYAKWVLLSLQKN